MSTTTAGVLQIAALVAALALVHKPLGDYVARVFTSTRHLAVERVGYRLGGVNPDTEQPWSTYVLSLLSFSAVSLVFLYLLQRFQHLLPLSNGTDEISAHQAVNTAVSFVTNANWQSYSGETIGHLTQMAGLTVQNFLSAAVGIAVVVALVRGFTRRQTGEIGNFWVDLTRGTIRILLPLAFVAAVLLIVAGVVQNFSGGTDVAALGGGTQTLPGGPVASQEAIKELGTNGGGFYNANSAHPFENPHALSSLFEVFLLLLIPSVMPRALGTLLGNRKQGLAILAVMGVLWLASVVAVTAAEVANHGTAAQLAGASMEGKETRFGVWASTLFAASTTGTSTGAVNSFHDSYTAAGGVTLVNMMLGEASPGGVGSGLYCLLIIAVLAVFLAGLMVGRTPEFLGKKIGRREITLVALYVLAMPFALLVGAALAVSFPETREAMANAGPHGLSEVLYAFASASNNNGSAFAGLTVNTWFYDLALGLAMLLGRFLPIVFVLRLAGALAEQKPVRASVGTLPTHGPLFAGLVTGVVVIVAGLTFFPALALGPIVEALQ
ncbi:MAG: potassium-transporting ATPase subunit KdpA [Streptosporangiales bacterium]|nr:potassium-transporting ATPase subunit KdpA [Streptosporangiales bacterium]